MLFSTVYQLCLGGQCTYPCFSRVLLTSTLHNIPSKLLAAFPHNHCRNNRQGLARNESCRNDNHQSSERILAEPRIELATSFSQVHNATDWVMGLGIKNYENSSRCIADWLFSLGYFLKKRSQCYHNHISLFYPCKTSIFYNIWKTSIFSSAVFGKTQDIAIALASSSCENCDVL